MDTADRSILHPTRRVLLAGASASVALTMPLPGLAQQTASAPRRILALVVGINEYRGRMLQPRASPSDPQVFAALNPLKGAVNDARVIAAALNGLKADLRVLLDREATKAAIVNRLTQMIAQARPGDLLFFSISGHGGQERERRPGSTPSGLEETLILGGFDSRHAPGERIFNDELGRIIRSAASTGARFVYVADTCHSGGSVRRMDPRIHAIAGYRGQLRYDVEADLSAPPPPDSGTKVPAADIAHLLFLAGAQANELVPEIRINGQYHGALSHAVALALAGGAIENGRLTAGSLSRFVLRTVRTTSDSIQHPNMIWPNPAAAGGLRIVPEEVLFDAASAASAPVAGPAAPAVAPSVQPAALPFWVLDTSPAEASAMLAPVPGLALAPSADQATLFYDPAQKRVLDRAGRPIAEGIAPAGLAVIAQRQRALDSLRALAIASGLDTRVALAGEAPDGEPTPAGDDVHPAGTRLRVVVRGFRARKLVVFNLAGNGTVQFLYPIARFNDPAEISGATYGFPVVVKAPFGADHVVAIASARPLTGLVQRLATLDGRANPTEAAEAVNAMLAGIPHQIGIQGIFTRA